MPLVKVPHREIQLQWRYIISLPLLSAISSADVRHVEYADDLSGAGDLESLSIWWSKLLRHGPSMGYYPNASKSWLVVKPMEHLQKAEQIFKGTNIKIITDGKKTTVKASFS